MRTKSGDFAQWSFLSKKQQQKDNFKTYNVLVHKSDLRNLF